MKFSNRFFHDLFCFTQKLGYHITHNHFYSPIPDTRDLNKNLWDNQEIKEVNLDDNQFFELLLEFSKYKKEYSKFPTSYNEKCSYQYFDDNGSFQSVDAVIYYCMIRQFKPKRIFEIGSGFSTYLAAQALLKNEEEMVKKGKLIAIDPYPNSTIKKGFPGFYKLIKSKVEDVELAFFKELEQNDILFIDSSHVLKIGSDVQYEYLKLIPSINKGVIVHIHDIFLPSEYPKEWIFKHHRFWNEQYLLQAFLMFNHSFEVLWAGNYMSINYPEKLKKMIPSYNKRGNASFWMQRKF